ncbi:hypothetical protein F4781DRAFT_438490 [Annulohypoxylon bovei var. microspora]|nr:hypothetical protein F4781DRAFT_438490 [Annulohypoxylon bovei var. microspora]
MAAMTSSAPALVERNVYKYEWARYVARRTLEEDLDAVKARIRSALKPDPNNIPVYFHLPTKETSISDLLKQTKKFTGLGLTAPEKGNIKIGIVGAGAAGLFTAMLFDWLNEEVEGLNIDYDVIEAAGEDRLGGRLFTFKFSEKEHDYYDVGAMRFPENEVMRRTFELFEYIGLRKGKGGLIPYYLGDDNNVCPSYFNDVHQVGRIWKTPEVNDPYNINSGLPEDGKIPIELLQEDPATLVGKALEEFITTTKAKLDDRRDSLPKNSEEENEFWEFLMRADNMSVRQFLASTDNGPLPEGPGYNFNTIEWLETATYGTGWYDQSLSECVLEELDFALKEGEAFWCIDGGAQKLAQLMKDKIKNPVQFHSQVTAINANISERKGAEEHVPMTLTIKKTDPDTMEPETITENYFAVFNSTTLGALQRMNLQDAGLLWGTKQAIRALGYGASCKVAIKFSRAWWQVAPFNINLGGVSRTDLPLRVCVYPSYNIEQAEGDEWDPEKPSVLLCSYTWGQDAQKLGSLISRNTPEDEEQLKSVMLHNLALLHANDAKPYGILRSELENDYMTHHAWDWYHDENMSGAFAYFGPGQFSNMWEEIIKPDAFGQLYLVGEAASSHHGWVVGALESVVRAAFVMFEGLHSGDPYYEPYQKAMDLLSHVPGPDEPSLPFYPLPREMPKRQQRTKRDAKQTDNPRENLPLTYAAGIALLSLVESFVELVVPTQT